MPAEHHIDDTIQIITTTWKGDATDSELLKSLKEYQKNIQCKPEYLNYNEIFDLSKASNVRLTINGLINIGRMASNTDHLFIHKKLALIVNSNLVFGFARMYESYRNMGISSCKKIRVFKNLKMAIEWTAETQSK